MGKLNKVQDPMPHLHWLNFVRRLRLDAVGAHHGLQTHGLCDQDHLNYQICCNALRRDKIWLTRYLLEYFTFFGTNANYINKKLHIFSGHIQKLQCCIIILVRYLFRSFVHCINDQKVRVFIMSYSIWNKKQKLLTQTLRATT